MTRVLLLALLAYAVLLVADVCVRWLRSRKDREMIDMTQELKPCPFCGSRALYEIYQTIDGFEVPVMFCDMCKAMFTVEGAEDWVTGERDGMDELRSAWNTRAERMCKQNRLFNLMSRECDGEYYQWHGEEMPRYCPNCGAKVVDA